MRRPAPAVLPLALVGALLAGTVSAGAAGAAKPAKAPVAASAAQPDECALRYHASLKAIGANDLPLLGSAAAGAPASNSVETAADQALPGFPLFVAPPRQRRREETAALTAAVALARTRGRSTAMTAAPDGGDRTWIAARLREDLGDYLNQKPTPYLCRGVPAYVRTLRSFAERIGPTADHRAEWLETQRRLAEGSVQAAREAIERAKAPAASPPPPAETDLRPTAGIVRAETAPAAPAMPDAKLDDEAGLVAAIDGLVAAARAANLVTDPPVAVATPRPVATPAAAAPLPRPVLAKLAEAKPLVTSTRPLVRERNARLRMLAAFSDLEMLDYLMKAGPETPDPVAGAIGRTLADIEAAHQADCTCAAGVSR